MAEKAQKHHFLPAMKNAPCRWQKRSFAAQYDFRRAGASVLSRGTRARRGRGIIGGMPTCIYTAAVASEICKRLSDGESLRAICRDAGMPPEGTVRQWARDNRDNFAERYREARAMLVERWADEIIEIADDETIEPNSRRVRVDTRKWLMSKLAPRQYGDKLVHSGDPEHPIHVMHRRVGIADMEPNELAAVLHLAAALESRMVDDDIAAVGGSRDR